MLRVAYLFERFPSFGQTFCYREVAELERQSAEVTVFSIRRPTGEPAQDWEPNMVRRVLYLPDEAELVKQIDAAAHKGELPGEAVRALKQWGRQSDFLRLYQAAFVGRVTRELGLDRVHAHFAGMAARTAFWLHDFFRVRYSVTAHANDIFAPRDFVVSLERIFDAAAAIVTVSDFAADQLRRQFPTDAAKVHRIYNGVDVESFGRAKLESTAMPRILAVGRLIEKKGFADLIAACALLKARGCEFRCEIIGEGPLEGTLRDQISTAQLTDRVALLGPRTQIEIAERLQAATVFALPCVIDREGGMDNLPTVIMEAMAAGLPVISTPVAGVPEMVQPGVNGELAPAGDSAALAAALERVISDAPRAKSYGEHGRALASERFSLEANVRALAEMLATT